MTAAVDMSMDGFNPGKEGEIQTLTAAAINHNNVTKKSIGS